MYKNNYYPHGYNNSCGQSNHRINNKFIRPASKNENFNNYYNSDFNYETVSNQYIPQDNHPKFNGEHEN